MNRHPPNYGFGAGRNDEEARRKDKTRTQVVAPFIRPHNEPPRALPFSTPTSSSSSSMGPGGGGGGGGGGEAQRYWRPVPPMTDNVLEEYSKCMANLSALAGTSTSSSTSASTTALYTSRSGYDATPSASRSGYGGSSGGASSSRSGYGSSSAAAAGSSSSSSASLYTSRGGYDGGATGSVVASSSRGGDGGSRFDASTHRSGYDARSGYDGRSANPFAPQSAYGGGGNEPHSSRSEFVGSRTDPSTSRSDYDRSAADPAQTRGEYSRSGADPAPARRDYEGSDADSISRGGVSGDTKAASTASTSQRGLGLDGAGLGLGVPQTSVNVVSDEDDYGVFLTPPLRSLAALSAPAVKGASPSVKAPPFLKTIAEIMFSVKVSPFNEPVKIVDLAMRLARVALAKDLGFENGQFFVTLTLDRIIISTAMDATPHLAEAACYRQLVTTMTNADYVKLCYVGNDVILGLYADENSALSGSYRYDLLCGERKVSKDRLPRCSNCDVTGHSSHFCLERQSTDMMFVEPKEKGKPSLDKKQPFKRFKHNMPKKTPPSVPPPSVPPPSTDPASTSAPPAPVPKPATPPPTSLDEANRFIKQLMAEVKGEDDKGKANVPPSSVSRNDSESSRRKEEEEKEKDKGRNKFDELQESLLALAKRNNLPASIFNFSDDDNQSTDASTSLSTAPQPLTSSSRVKKSVTPPSSSSTSQQQQQQQRRKASPDPPRSSSSLAKRRRRSRSDSRSISPDHHRNRDGEKASSSSSKQKTGSSVDHSRQRDRNHQSRSRSPSHRKSSGKDNESRSQRSGSRNNNDNRSSDKRSAVTQSSSSITTAVIDDGKPRLTVIPPLLTTTSADATDLFASCLAPPVLIFLAESMFTIKISPLSLDFAEEIVEDCFKDARLKMIKEFYRNSDDGRYRVKVFFTWENGIR